jgi:hypothetical protein
VKKWEQLSTSTLLFSSSPGFAPGVDSRETAPHELEL